MKILNHFLLTCIVCTSLHIQSACAEISSCPFCDPQVIQRQLVYEESGFWVLLDHHPATAGHLLVIPKNHVEKAHELSKQQFHDLSDVIRACVKAFETVLDTDQYFILEKNGPDAFQTVPHVHFHLVP